MRVNPAGARTTIQRHVDVHIFLFPFALDTRADGAACQSEGTVAKRVETEGKRMRAVGGGEGTVGGGSGNEIEVGSEGEVGSPERKGEKGGEREGMEKGRPGKRDEEVAAEGGG